jgi:hypothetical protein
MTCVTQVRELASWPCNWSRMQHTSLTGIEALSFSLSSMWAHLSLHRFCYGAFVPAVIMGWWKYMCVVYQIYQRHTSESTAAVWHAGKFDRGYHFLQHNHWDRRVGISAQSSLSTWLSVLVLIDRGFRIVGLVPIDYSTVSMGPEHFISFNI